MAMQGANVDERKVMMERGSLASARTSGSTHHRRQRGLGQVLMGDRNRRLSLKVAYVSAGNPRPLRPVSPGEVLRDELAARGWTQTELARRLDRPVQAVNEIVNARKAVTAETALGLADVLGTSAEFWMNLESAYRIGLARHRRQAG
jgi:addiction module HigA family antidote